MKVGPTRIPLSAMIGPVTATLAPNRFVILYARAQTHTMALSRDLTRPESTLPAVQ